jgi:hypothetical protein
MKQLRNTKGNSVTARIDRSGAQHWRVERGDYGPLIFHRHPDSEHPPMWSMSEATADSPNAQLARSTWS